MSEIKEQLYHKIEIITQEGKVYLVNKLNESISALVYNTSPMATRNNEIGISDVSHYQVQDIPVGYAVEIETLDGAKEDSICYQITAVETASIAFKGTFIVKQKAFSGVIKLLKIADCTIKKINLVDDETAINKLYWLAEDLKSYTDLTGGRFDIDHAQRRLFPMQTILEKVDLPQVQALYNEVIELLEVAAFFDKMAFSQKVDELYQFLEHQQ